MERQAPQEPANMDLAAAAMLIALASAILGAAFYYDGAF
jgi:hypothetical protein